MTETLFHSGIACLGIEVFVAPLPLQHQVNFDHESDGYSLSLLILWSLVVAVISVFSFSFLLFLSMRQVNIMCVFAVGEQQ